MDQVIVLNADGQFLNTVTWQEGVTLLYTEKAVVVTENIERVLRSAGNRFTQEVIEMFAPLVIQLKRMVTKIFKPRTGYNRQNVFARDNWTCQYCGIEKADLDQGQKLTIDHVVPRAQGGKTNYENCVTSCCTCNGKKADRTPDEAGMKLKRAPIKPSPADFIRMKAKQDRIIDRLRELKVL